MMPVRLVEISEELSGQAEGAPMHYRGMLLEAAQALRAYAALLESRVPSEAGGSVWIVMDESGQPDFVCSSKQGAQEHINDAITDDGIEEASDWIVREYVPAPLLERLQQKDAAEAISIGSAPQTHDVSSYDGEHGLSPRPGHGPASGQRTTRADTDGLSHERSLGRHEKWCNVGKVSESGLWMACNCYLSDPAPPRGGEPDWRKYRAIAGCALAGTNEVDELVKLPPLEMERETLRRVHERGLATMEATAKAVRASPTGPAMSDWKEIVNGQPMPPLGQRVQIYIGNAVRPQQFTAIRKQFENGHRAWIASEEDDDSGYAGKYVTHWRELPEGPQRR